MKKHVINGVLRRRQTRREFITTCVGAAAGTATLRPMNFALSAEMSRSSEMGLTSDGSPEMNRRERIPFNAGAQHIGSYDVVVAGGGPAGTAAAVAASRAGARTLLVESQGCLGGVGTSGGVACFLGSQKRGKHGPAVAGFFKELVDQMVSDGSACTPGANLGGVNRLGLRDHVLFDIEACKRHLDDLVLGAGVKLLLFTGAVAPQMNGRKVEGVFLFNKDGLSFAEGKVVIDCTGDSDIAFRAGFATVKGRKDTGLMTPATVISFMEDVDREPLAKYLAEGGDRRFRGLVNELREKGIWTYPEETIIVVPTMRKDVFMINTRRQVGVDGTNARSLTDAMVHGRRDAQEFLDRVLRPYYPGFKNARLRRAASVVGIRETRKIVGEYTLTEHDCIKGDGFSDTIALSGYGWDLPDPKRPSLQPFSKDFWGKATPMSKPFVEIPYRCLIPQGSENLLVAGRCISVEEQVLGPVRIMPACYAIGQAAGTAAALCVGNGCTPANVSVDALRKSLLDQGAILE